MDYQQSFDSAMHRLELGHSKFTPDFFFWIIYFPIELVMWPVFSAMSLDVRYYLWLSLGQLWAFGHIVLLWFRFSSNEVASEKMVAWFNVSYWGHLAASLFFDLEVFRMFKLFKMLGIGFVARAIVALILAVGMLVVQGSYQMFLRYLMRKFTADAVLKVRTSSLDIESSEPIAGKYLTLHYILRLDPADLLEPAQDEELNSIEPD